MKSDVQTLQIEVTIAPAEGRKGDQRGRASGPKVPDPPRILRITRLMALAIKFQDMVDRREVRDYADLARLGCVTRARLTQIMNLCLLAPDLQERILSTPETAALRETQLREIACLVEWDAQRRRFSRLTQTLRTD